MKSGAWRLGWDKGIILLLVLIILFGGMNNEFFMTGDNVNFIIGDISEVMLIAFPMALLIIVKEIDLSVASLLTLASAVTGVTWQATQSIWIAMLAGLLTGTIGGLVNGLLVTGLGLSSLAVTIGTLALYRGLCFVVLGDTPIADFPMEFTDLGYIPIPGTFLPWVIVPMVIAGALFWYLLHGTRFGRWLFAMGQGDEAAEFSGIPVLRVKLILFVLTGLHGAIRLLIAGRCTRLRTPGHRRGPLRWSGDRRWSGHHLGCRRRRDDRRLQQLLPTADRLGRQRFGHRERRPPINLCSTAASSRPHPRATRP